MPASSFTVVSSTTITAVVDTGATGNVSVTTNLGGTATLAGFTYTGPSIASFNPSSGIVGSTITITGSNFTGATSVSFGGVPASSFTVGISNQHNRGSGPGQYRKCAGNNSQWSSIARRIYIYRTDHFLLYANNR